MIFVAVGTTDFDELIAEMDRLAPTLSEKVVMQIGNGRYIPRNTEYFRFAPSLNPYYEQCDLVVAHGGFGIVMETLEKGKKLICVENTAVHGRHQSDLLGTLAQQKHLIWCHTPAELPKTLAQAKQTEFRPHISPQCEISKVITNYLHELEKDQEQMKPTHSVASMRFRKLVRRAVVSIMHFSGFSRLLGLIQSQYQARILVYHSISDDPLNPFSVPPADFEEQIRFLAEKFNVISLEELANYLHNDKPIPPHSVVITLDDGYKDNYTNAYPILKKYRVPATMFLIVNRVELNDQSLSPSPNEQADSYLSWAEVREMSAQGISFGSHTLNHVSLTSLSLTEARREIQEAKIILEKQIGRPITLFSYPFGTIRHFNEELKKIVAESGYTCACIGLNGLNTQSTNPYFLKRTKIEVNDGMFVFEKTMKGGLDIFILLDLLRRFLPVSRPNQPVSISSQERIN